VNCAAIPETLIEKLFGHEGILHRSRPQAARQVRGGRRRDDLPRRGGHYVAPPRQGAPRAPGEEDLYYRLNVLNLRTPALAERPEDVPTLVLHFADHFARTNNYRPKKFTEEALAELAARPWPGNVRELKNTIERLMIMIDGDVVDAVHVTEGGPSSIAAGDGRILEAVREALGPAPAMAAPAAVDEVWQRLLATQTLQSFQDEAEKLYLVAKLAENGGNVTRTAESIDTPRSNLYKKIDRYGLRREKAEGPEREETPA
jgi:two-component system nitrogen regulation response regulator NtrX